MKDARFKKIDATNDSLIEHDIFLDDTGYYMVLYEVLYEGASAVQRNFY